MKLSPAEILEEAMERRGISAGRLNMYRRSANAYYGVHDEENGQFTGMSATGAPLIRLNQLRSDIAQRVGAPNMLMPIVDDFVALKRVVPTMRILPWDETDEVREKAARFSRLVRTQWT